METNLINRWLEQGLITTTVAAQMRADARAARGASTWLILAAACLNGVVLFAFTRLHGLTVGVHEILLLWLVCLLPLAYGTRAKALAASAAVLFIAWFIAVTFRDLSLFATVDRALLVAPLLVLGGVTAFSLGGLHYLMPGFDSVARPARIVGLQASVVGLFAMTIERVAGGTRMFNQLRDLDASTQVTISCIAAGLVTIAATIIGQSFRERAPKLTVVEAAVNVVLVLTASAFVLLPMSGETGSLIASVVLLLLVGSVFAVGMRTNDGRLVRVSGFSLAFYLSSKLTLLLIGREVAIVVAVAVGGSLLVAGAFGIKVLSESLRKPEDPNGKVTEA